MEDPGQVRPLLDSSPDKEWEDKPTWNGLERDFKTDFDDNNDIEPENRAIEMGKELKDDKPSPKDTMNLIDFTQ